MDVDHLIEVLQEIQKAGRGKEIVEAFDLDEDRFFEVTSLNYGSKKPGEGIVTIHTGFMEPV